MHARKRPLLVIHLLKVDGDHCKGAITQPVVAYSISFPKTEREEKRVEYVVNTTWLRENFRDDLEEEELGGDNGQ